MNVCEINEMDEKDKNRGAAQRRTWKESLDKGIGEMRGIK
jgi:hypothetical protein